MRSAASTARSAASSTRSTPRPAIRLPAPGNELTAIASVVLGGTLLTGGVGMVAGTLFGGMILGLIATLINFNGSLNGAWIMISGGVLLFLFIVMQRSLRRLRSGCGARLEDHSRSHGARLPTHFAPPAAGRVGAAATRAARDKRSSATSTRQLAGRLGREIVGGIYPPGSLLPNAAEMCARFSVSRTALREAYSVLTAKALIVARPKIGTRVRPEGRLEHARSGGARLASCRPTPTRGFRRRTVRSAPDGRAGGGGARGRRRARAPRSTASPTPIGRMERSRTAPAI